jgi:hypothetical protein
MCNGLRDNAVVRLYVVCLQGEDLALCVRVMG